MAWIVSGVLGSLFAGWLVLDSLRHRRLGVDVIALLALVGALAVGEYLAAAVISLMVTSGRTLEAWAAGRARRDLQALLARAPRTPTATGATPWRRSTSTRWCQVTW